MIPSDRYRYLIGKMIKSLQYRYRIGRHACPTFAQVAGGDVTQVAAVLRRHKRSIEHLQQGGREHLGIIGSFFGVCLCNGFHEFENVTYIQIRIQSSKSKLNRDLDQGIGLGNI